MEFGPAEVGHIVRLVLQRIQDRKLALSTEQMCDAIRAYAGSIQKPIEWYHITDFEKAYEEQVPALDKAIDAVMNAVEASKG